MHPSNTIQIPDSLPQVISALGQARFPAQLLAWLNHGAAFDSAVVMAYPTSGNLEVLFNDLHAGDQTGFTGPYREGLWVLSPLHLSAQAGVRGFFHMPDIAPQNLEDSDYYGLYYSSNGVIDHCGYLLESGDGTPLAISLERTQALPTFSAAERALLASLAPLVRALIQQHWPGAPPAMAVPAKEPALHAQVNQVLQRFGSSSLTPRERDVVKLVLRGLPSKKVASQLGISTQTEQVHRKNIYQKLGLSSHNQLFSLFFDALVLGSTGDSDPLATVLAQKTPT